MYRTSREEGDASTIGWRLLGHLPHARPREGVGTYIAQSDMRCCLT